MGTMQNLKSMIARFLARLLRILGPAFAFARWADWSIPVDLLLAGCACLQLEGIKEFTALPHFIVLPSLAATDAAFPTRSAVPESSVLAPGHGSTLPGRALETGDAVG